MGGGGSDNSWMWQAMQAQEARAREDQRQARIKAGRTNIDQAFSSLDGTGDTTFYDRYGKAISDYYLPQLQNQYANANKELTYRLADAGTLRSSAANEVAADLSRQNALNIAGLNAKTDQAKADLRSRVANEKNTAINQLYATEDPDMALTTALNSVKGVSLAEPDLSPLANVFNVALVGGANAIKAWQNQGLGNYAAQSGPSAQGLPQGSGSFIR